MNYVRRLAFIHTYLRRSLHTKRSFTIGRRSPSLSAKERMLFAKRLSIMLRSGMPIQESLMLIRDESYTKRASLLFTEIERAVSHGETLSHSLSKYPRVFNQYAVGMVQVGEISGTLHENLEYLAEELKRAQALRGKIIGALMYPLILIVATVGMTLALTMFIFPKIVPIFQSVRVQLPWSTRVLMAISSFLLRDGWWLLIGIIAFVIIAGFVRKKIARVRMWCDRAMFRIPIIGTMLRDYHVATICRTLSLLIKSDVDIVTGINLIARATNNRAYQEALTTTSAALSKGLTLSSQLAAYPRLFPPLVKHMVSVGEGTGNLSTSLAYVATNVEEDIETLTRNLTTLLEPVLMITMGIIVGFIAISIILPIYGITEHLSPTATHV